MSTSKNALGFIFITVLIDFTGIGIIIPVLPDLLTQLTGQEVNEASPISGWLAFSYAIMQFLCSPVLGGLSDRYGRRPILLASLLGLGIDFLFCAFAPTLIWLFIGRAIAGICGASFTTASAYIADISSPEKRAQNFGMIGAAFGLGFIIGPALGSLFGIWGTRAPFIAAGVLSMLNFLYGYFVLPESLAQNNRRKFEWKRANPIGAFIHLRKYPVLIGLVIGLTLLYIAGQAMPATWSFYSIHKFGWDKTLVGLSLSFAGIMIALVQGFLIRLIVPKIGTTKAVIYGLLLNLIGFFLYAFATEGWMMFAITAIYALGGIGGPAIQGIISNQVPDNEQGEIQGLLSSLMGIAAILGPLLMTYLFNIFTTRDGIHFPGAPFFMAGILTVIGIFFFAVFMKKQSTTQKQAEK